MQHAAGSIMLALEGRGRGHNQETTFFTRAWNHDRDLQLWLTHAYECVAKKPRTNIWASMLDVTLAYYYYLVVDLHIVIDTDTGTSRLMGFGLV
jgi:hypothetical protein